MKHVLKPAVVGLFFLSVLLQTALVAQRPQATNLAVCHRAGQTFITWREVGPPAAVDDDDDDATMRKTLERIEKEGRIRYRIYRSGSPFDSARDAQLVAEVAPGGCWNRTYYGIYGKEGQPAVRYVITGGGEALANGTGFYVHNPKAVAGGKGFYAVTYVADGVENTAIISANSTAEPVIETKGQGVGVLQRIVKADEFNYIKNAELHYYVRWESPPNASVENKPIDYVVAIPPDIEKRPTPVGLHLHCWGGSLNGGYGWWYHYGRLGTTYLIASNQEPYDWWTGYHELYYSKDKSKDAWRTRRVHPYTTRRMLSFLDWAAGKYELDLNRVFTAGSSMGGGGSPMFAIRHSDRIAWAVSWVGVHDPGNTPQFAGSYERVYGKKDWGILFEDGSSAFEYYKDAAYLRKYPKKEIGLVTFANAKNDGGIGWPQAVEFLEALQDTHRPHVFVWGLSGHGQRAEMPADGGQRIMPLDIRLGQSLPAFTNCSLDDNPGTATLLSSPKEVKVGREVKKDSFDGDSVGQINLHLYWETETIVDTPNRWEITVKLTDAAPARKCTVDITPRRLQHFKIEPNETLKWTNSLAGKQIQSGRTAADECGLITLRQITVLKQGAEISITR